jgi:HEAT repeat protein
MDEIETLIKQLKDPDEKTRINAGRKLGEQEDPRIIPALIDVLTDMVDGYPNYAAKALAKIGKPAVLSLISATSKEDGRANATWALGEIGDSRAAPSVIEVLNSQYELVQLSAAQALGKIAKQNPEIRRLLKDPISKQVEALDDENIKVRIHAVHMLGEFRDVSAVSALIKAMENLKEERKRAGQSSMIQDMSDLQLHKLVYAIGEIADHNPEDSMLIAAMPEMILVLHHLDPYLRLRAASALAAMGEQSLPELVGTLKGDNWYCWLETIQALEEFVERSIVLEQLEEIEKGIGEGLASMRNKCKTNEYWEEETKKRIIMKVESHLAKLRIAIAKRKNELTQDKGVLLNDKPKPKKGNKLYQRLRRSLNG